MSETSDNPLPYETRWLNPQTALRWYRRLVLGMLWYSLIVVLWALTTLFLLLDQPYGGFFWSWDNTHGVYRVDNASPEEMIALQPADFILAVEGYSGSAVSIYNRAKELYNSASPICLVPSRKEPPIVHYTVLRRGETLEVQSPVLCFRFSSLLRVAAIPFSLGLLLWLLGGFVYRAGPQEETNLAFAACTALAANILVTQGANMPDLQSVVGRMTALVITNLSPALLVPAVYHMVAVLPRQHSAGFLYRTRWLWYAFIPITLIVLGSVRFQLGANWYPLVGLLDSIANWGTGLSLYSLAIIASIRYLYIYRTTSSLQTKAQIRIIGLSILAAIVGVPLLVIQQEPHLAPFLTRLTPINPLTLFFWLVIVFIGFAYAILRYQVFTHRLKGLYVLIALAVAVGAALIYVSIPLPDPELGFVVLLITLIGLSLFWTLPNPLQKLLQRWTSPSTVQRKQIEQFTNDIQDTYDLDLLPLKIVQSLECHLQLSFAALWSEQDGTLILEACTDRAPTSSLPDALPTDTIWQEQPVRLTSGTLMTIGCEIALPLAVSKNRIGVLGLGRRWTEEVFDETDLEALGVMAHQAALTLNTARQIRTLHLVALQVEQAQLEERDRIAKDLHDSTQAQLTQLSFALARVRSQLNSDPDNAKRILNLCIENVAQAGQELRAILRALIPEHLLGRNLVAALQEHINNTQVLYGTVTINLQAAPEIEEMLNLESKLALLQICQQGLDNALTHAQANSIDITLQPSRDRDVVEFSIVDNGRGFIRRSTSEFTELGHHGLYIMESRALKHGGHLTIESTPGRGTVVKGYLPVMQISH